MSILKDSKTGEWINDVNGIVSYDGDYKVIVDDVIDDCDTMFEILECHGKDLIKKQKLIQKNALEKFKKLDHTEMTELSKSGKSSEFVEMLEKKALAFCKKNKKVIPVILYIDYIYNK